MKKTKRILLVSTATCRRAVALFLVKFITLLLATFPVHAATRVWLNPVNGSWSQTNNWSGGVVPTASDDAYITNSGTFTVTNDAGATFATLTLGGVSGMQSLNWSASSLSGATIIGTNGTLNLVGAGTKNLLGPITNYGSVVWTSGSTTTWSWYGASGARLENRPGGLVDVQLDGTFSTSSGTPVINNAGTFRKSGGSGALAFNTFVFTNSGLVSVQSGNLDFASGFGSSGIFDITNGASVLLNGGTFTFAAGHTFNGNGYYGVTNNGSATIIGPIINTNFQLSGALTVSNELDGILWWNGGYLYGALTVAPGGVLNLVRSGTKYLMGAITNYGQVVWSSGSGTTWSWYGANGARLENRPGGLVDVQLDGNFSTSSGTPVINNAGTFRKSGGSGALAFNTFVFTNSGLVSVQTGGFNFTGGFGSSGIFDITNGASVLLNGGTFTFAAGHTFNGNGYYGVTNNGSATIIGPIINTNFQLSGALTITNELDGILWWNGGYLYGALTVAPGGALNLVRSGTKYLMGAITNYGQVVWSSGSATTWTWYGTGGARLENRPGGLVDVQLDGTFSTSSGTPIINNAGTFRKSAGSGALAFNTFVFTNSGLVSVQTGSLDFASGFGSSGIFDITNGASVLLNGGTFTFAAGHTFNGNGYYGVTNNGSATIIGPIINTNFQLSGALTITNELDGILWWNGGYLYGALTVAPGGALNLVRSGTKYLMGAITNYGQVVWSSGSATTWTWYGTGGARLENRPGGLVDVQLDGAFSASSGTPVINNVGTFRKSAGSGSLAFNAFVFTNRGLVSVQSGSLDFTSGFGSSGTFDITNGTSVLLNGGTFIFAAGHTFTGNGYYGVTNTGNATIYGPIINTNFQLSGALTISNELDGILWWNGGYLYGALTVAPGASLNLVRSGTKYLMGAITNYGQVVWSSGSATTWTWYGTGGAQLENRPGGLVDVQLDGTFSTSSGTTVINNAGTFRKSGGSGTTTFSGAFIFANQGELRAQTGTIQPPNAYSETPSANLAVAIGGTIAGTQYGHIHFAAAPTFAGKFKVVPANGFSPSPGNSFAVLSYPSAAGNFIAMDGLDYGNGLRLAPSATKTALTLTTVSVPTSSQAKLLSYILPSSILVSWPIEFTGYNLYSTTNLAAPVWTPLSVAGNNNTVLPTALPVQYFRLSNP